MGRKRKYLKPVTFRISKNHYKKIIKDAKKNGNVGNVLRRIVDEHYNHKVFKYRLRNNLIGFLNLIIGGIKMNKKIIALSIISVVAIAGMLFGIGLQPVYQVPVEQHTYLDGVMSILLVRLEQQ